MHHHSTPRPQAHLCPPLFSFIAQSEEELPERLAGSVRFSHLNLKNAAYLDEETGKIYRPQQV